MATIHRTIFSLKNSQVKNTDSQTISINSRSSRTLLTTLNHCEYSSLYKTSANKKAIASNLQENNKPTPSTNHEKKRYQATLEALFKTAGLNNKSIIKISVAKKIMSQCFGLGNHSSNMGERETKRAQSIKNKLEQHIEKENSLSEFISRIKIGFECSQFPVDKYLKSLGIFKKHTDKTRFNWFINETLHHGYILDALLYLMSKGIILPLEFQRHWYDLKKERRLDYKRMRKLAALLSTSATMTSQTDIMNSSEDQHSCNIEKAYLGKEKTAQDYKQLIEGYSKHWGDIYQKWDIDYLMSTSEYPQFLLPTLFIPSLIAKNNYISNLEPNFVLDIALESYLMTQANIHP
ncbi:hypothetical protein [Agarilytica rhodophyticola]|uniref:hypothetical protein n=1 Tax=Agarilytica rhodophyticola TaxID=1737490 RepID=UPI001319BC26|nr:hypothetical protein [Agarilytica rhodophyticola]